MMEQRGEVLLAACHGCETERFSRPHYPPPNPAWDLRALAPRPSLLVTLIRLEEAPAHRRKVLLQFALDAIHRRDQFVRAAVRVAHAHARLGRQHDVGTELQ